MKILNALNTFELGVFVAPAEFGYVVETNVTLARISFDSMSMMLSRGDAIVTPTLTILHRSCMGDYSSRHGGLQLFRCDFEIKDGQIWLVPEASPSEDILLLLHWSSFKHRDKSLRETSDVKQLSFHGDGYWGDNFSVIHVQCGAKIEFTHTQSELIPAKRLFGFMHKKQLRTVEVTTQWGSLSQDGADLTI